MNNDEEIGQAVEAWLMLLKILLATSIIGLTLSILKPILLYFGIDWNL